MQTVAVTGTGTDWFEARALARAAPPLAVREVPLLAAEGLVLAAPLCAGGFAPPFDAAAMDGYAVNGAGPWRVVGRVLAGGSAWPGVLAAGGALEIATGAVVPAGTAAVVPYEQCRRDGDAVTAPAPGERRHIRRAGEDARPGDELAPPGRVVTATVLAAAAQAGVERMRVYRKPAVTVLVTGDEVVPGRPGPGQVRDALTPVVTALVTRGGGETVDHRLLRDDSVLLRDAIAGGPVADVVVVTGSSSAGAADHLREVLAGLGARWLVESVASRPGRPQTLAVTAAGRWVVGLPGNPFAGLVAGLTVLEPLVAALAGRPPARPWRLPVTGEARLVPGGVRITPVRLDEDGSAHLFGGAGPSSLRTTATADALAVLPADWTSGAEAELLTPP